MPFEIQSFAYGDGYGIIPTDASSGDNIFATRIDADKELNRRKQMLAELEEEKHRLNLDAGRQRAMRIAADSVNQVFNVCLTRGIP